jgi:hypothetical protein
MSELGQRRYFRHACIRSAVTPKAEIAADCRNFRFVPEPNSRLTQNATSLAGFVSPINPGRVKFGQVGWALGQK